MKPFLLLIAVFFMLSKISTAQELIKDIQPGTNSGQPQKLVSMGNNVYFIANDGTHGNELWKSDGTTQGTVMVMDINPGSADGLVESYYISTLTVMNNNVYFFADDGSNGYELWKSDGTSSGTSMVKDINPNAGSGITASLTELCNTGSYLLFNATDGTNGNQLWKSDGTAGGTQVVKITNPGSDGYPQFFYYCSSLNLTFFTAIDAGNGFELWKTDGTTGGTSLVQDINPGSTGSAPYGFVALNNKVYFEADGAFGYELYVTDGTLSGTQLVKDINPGANSSYPDYLVAFNNKLFFQATDGSNGYELWSSDGTEGGTNILKNINPNSPSSNPSYLTVIWNKLFFSADDGTHGNELWMSDGTTPGTALLLDIDNVSNQSSSPYGLYAANGVLYFEATDGTNGGELWSSDGTASGTMMLNQICPGSCSSFPLHFCQAGNTLFFTANETNTGDELYKLDLPTAVKNISADNNIILYPNPAVEELNINFKNNGNAMQYTISIKNLAGQTLMTNKTADAKTQVNVSGLPAGMYFVEISDGVNSVVKKFIKC